jgi:thiol-disulfide isomerase/thioredoxin
VVKGTITSSTDNGPKTVTSLELRSVQVGSRETVLQLSAESEVLVDGAKAYEELMEQAEPSVDKELIAKAKTVLASACGKLTAPMLREKAVAALKWHEKLAEIYAQMAADRAQRIGKPSPQWEASDLDGKPVALKDYRGKVVVLDFWGRWCGACMKGMPDINRLADDFKDEAVAVLAMSADGKEKDARLVVEKMGIRYPTIKAHDLCEKYHVTSFPTLIVIDGKGTIREIHFGYQTALHGQVSKIIRKLLTESKSGTAE